MKGFVLASNNKGKIAELRTILSKLMPGCEVLSLQDIGYTDDIAEDGETFEENAFIKASVPARMGYIGIADDSGLCVDALGGAPGIYSARYSGLGSEGNIDKLLGELSDVPDDERGAKFVCCICAVFPDGRKVSARGEAHGLILHERHGKGGFGYDPVFYYPPLYKSFAELNEEEKNNISHRGLALDAFCPLLIKETGC